MLPSPSVCWFIHFSELQKGQMIQRFRSRGDPGQAAVGCWVVEMGWLFIWASSCPAWGGLCTWDRCAVPLSCVPQFPLGHPYPVEWRGSSPSSQRWPALYLLSLVMLKGKTTDGDNTAPLRSGENRDHDYRFIFDKSCSNAIQSFLWPDSGNCNMHPVAKILY